MTDAPSLGRYVLLDTNLLLVLVVGLTEPGLIRKHKRTSAYTVEDFDFLAATLKGRSLIATPHILTEVSNLGCIGLTGSTLERFLATLKRVITGLLEEREIAARSAVEASIYSKLGLTDASIERLAEQDIVILTTDAPLWARLNGRGLKAVNYNHIRPGLAGIM